MEQKIVLRVFTVRCICYTTAHKMGGSIGKDFFPSQTKDTDSFLFSVYILTFLVLMNGRGRVVPPLFLKRIKSFARMCFGNHLFVV